MGLSGYHNCEDGASQKEAEVQDNPECDGDGDGDASKKEGEIQDNPGVEMLRSMKY